MDESIVVLLMLTCTLIVINKHSERITSNSHPINVQCTRKHPLLLLVSKIITGTYCPDFTILFD